MDRNTVQRSLVSLALTRLNHPTAEDVYSDVIKEHPSVGKCTVYRNLAKLEEKGELKRIVMPDSPDRFDINLAPHFHGRCAVCGKIIDITLSEKPQLEKSISDAHGFSVSNYDVFFSGICAECKKTNNADTI